jgi:hypothetical protein
MKLAAKAEARLPALAGDPYSGGDSPWEDEGCCFDKRRVRPLRSERGRAKLARAGQVASLNLPGLSLKARFRRNLDRRELRSQGLKCRAKV